MSRRVSRTVALLALALGCVRYHPAPLQPLATAHRFAARRLDDPGLSRWLAAQGAQGPADRWGPRRIALAAVYFNPTVDSARAALRAAQAAEITAGARPQPSVTARVSRAGRPDQGKTSPWTTAAGIGVPVGVAGRVRARRAQARARTEAAALGLQHVAWRVALDAAGSAIRTDAAARDLRLAQQEQDTLAAVLALLRTQYAQGSVSRAEVARAEADLQTAAVTTAQRRQALEQRRTALARAIGLPVDAAAGIHPSAARRSGCALAEVISRDSLRSLALHRRQDLGAAGARYAAAEAGLRLEVARQYPTVILGPGIGWNQGSLAWSLALTVPQLLLNHNRGPIAQAAAERLVEAARFERVQQRVIREVGGARHACVAARARRAVADSLLGAARREVALAEAAYQRGETGRSAIAFAQLRRLRAARALGAADAEVALAGTTMDRALGGWLAAPQLTTGGLMESSRRSLRP